MKLSTRTPLLIDKAKKFAPLPVYKLTEFWPDSTRHSYQSDSLYMAIRSENTSSVVALIDRMLHHGLSDPSSLPSIELLVKRNWRKWTKQIGELR